MWKKVKIANWHQLILDTSVQRKCEKNAHMENTYAMKLNGTPCGFGWLKYCESIVSSLQCNGVGGSEYLPWLLLLPLLPRQVYGMRFICSCCQHESIDQYTGRTFSSR